MRRWLETAAILVTVNLVTASVPLVGICQQRATDEISKQASSLEAELGKFKDTSPEAADTLVKLVDLYHAHARSFGLIRAGQKFVASHPSDRRHRQVMLQLIDGLESMSRNRELAATCRQFLSKYTQATERPEIARRLAYTLDKLNERPAAAKVYRSLWEMQPNAAGRRHGLEAVVRFAASGKREDIVAGAELAEQIHAALPAGSYSAAFAIQAMQQWERIGQWAKANTIAKKVLSKPFGLDQVALRDIHRRMSDNYSRQGQHAHAVASLQQARSIRDDRTSHALLIERMYHAAVKAIEMQPVVEQYYKKYAEEDDRFNRLGYLAISFQRDGDRERARTLFGVIMNHQAATHNAAGNYVSLSPRKDPKQHPAIAKALQQAIDHPQQKQAYYARYILGFTVYRDLMKDQSKARATLRQMLVQTPPNNSYSWNALSYLLDSAANEQEFKQDLATLIDSRRKYSHLTSYRDHLNNWAKNARKRQKSLKRNDPALATLKTRVQLVSAALAATKDDAQIAGWTRLFSAKGSGNQAKARGVLLSKELMAKHSTEQYRRLLEDQAYYFRHYAPSKQRPQSIALYGQLVSRFPTDYGHALNYLAVATDYGPPEVEKEAALHLLGLEPQDSTSNPDAFRRMLYAAEQNKDAELAKRILTWMKKADSLFGATDGYATSIGDHLSKLGLDGDAVAYWRRGLTLNPNSSESYQCASRLLSKIGSAEDKKTAQRAQFVEALLKLDSNYHGMYATWLANEYVQLGHITKAADLLAASKQRQEERPFRPWNPDVWALHNVLHFRQDGQEIEAKKKLTLIQAVAAMELDWPSAQAELLLAEANDKLSPMERLLAYQRPTRQVHYDAHRWDQLMPHAQTAFTAGKYAEVATLVTGMLTNITGAGTTRQQAGRSMVARCYARIGSVGLTIDESSPAAPLLQAALYLRLGDERMAFDAFLANRQLFDKHRDEIPSDLILFVCDQLMAAGGQENHDQVEAVLRGWIIKYSESKQVDVDVKARFQLLLAKNYFRSQRYDVARSEFTTVMNRYADTPQAIEAEFGVGETFMAQKVFDQAERIFEKLSNNRDSDVVVRAEFLRGVLAFRRGEHEDARKIFREVLERSPNIDLANQTLFNLSEVFGAEERYLDQLNLLRTVGRLGRSSKRRHRPGSPLSIVVHDSDLGISRGHSRIEVIVTTEPGGDRETVYLTSGGASKGLFRVDVSTQLGEPAPDDGVLQLSGNDIVRCDYPEKFKKEFKRVPLSDVEIRVAADAKFEISSSKIVDVEKESFADRLARETLEKQQADERMSQGRPANQVKPGNLVYLRIADPDRDLSREADDLIVKLAADSGDQVQYALKETGPHTGLFEGQVRTGELPAGALATDMAIDHSPLMAIDLAKDSYWMSEPDGAAPKMLSVDMKDLKSVSHVTFVSPKPESAYPIRGELLGSQDGEFWFRIAGHPDLSEHAAAPSYSRMKYRVYAGNFTRVTRWQQIVDLGTNGQPVETGDADQLRWEKTADDEDAESPFAVIWHGKLPQDRAGAARIQVRGQITAIAVDGELVLPVGPGTRTVDVWLEQGLHDVTIFAATRTASTRLEATWAKSDFSSTKIALQPFQSTDFDLTSAPKADTSVSTTPSTTPAVNITPSDATMGRQTKDFGIRPKSTPAYLWNWKDTNDVASWNVDISRAGVYEVWLDLAHSGGGSKFHLQFGDQTIEGEVPNTGGFANNFRQLRVGGIAVPKAGRYPLSIKPTKIVGGGLMDLRGVTLKPTKASLAMSNRQWRFNFEPLDLRYVRFKVDEYQGEAVAISNVEVVGDKVHIPTKSDVLALAKNQILEIAGGDMVTATYTDEHNMSPQNASRLLTAELRATYFNANVSAIKYDFVRNRNGAVSTIPKRLLRVEPGERIVFQITDYDSDQTDKKDSVSFEVRVNDGEAVVMTATETDAYTGVFTKEVDTSVTASEGKLQVKPGDKVHCQYVDRQNTFPGHSVPRVATVYVNQPTDGLVRIFNSSIQPTTKESTLRPRPDYSVIKTPDAIARIALEAPLTVEVIDPDAAKDSGSQVVVLLKTSDGVTVQAVCAVSNAFDNTSPSGQDGLDYALQKGRFVGQVILQLGGKQSSSVVPLTSEMPRNLIGGPKIDDDDVVDGLTVHVLNVTGKDLIAAGYHDVRRPDGKDQVLASRGRLIVNGMLACTDQDYDKPMEQLHVGERLFLRVIDADRDSSDQRDTVDVVITTKSGERESIKLSESLAHSGIFTGSLMLKASEKPTPGNLQPEEPVLETYFGDTLQIQYRDPAASTESGTLDSQVDLPVVIGTNGLVSAFTKVFNNDALAIETKFHIAESYFELFKSHRELRRKEEEQADLKSGRRILKEVMEDYPDPKYAPRVAYLLGQFAQELEEWDDAIRSYDLIIRRYAEHSLAPDAQYKLAQCYEEAGDFDQALEGYVKLAATYPKSPLIASVMIRISDYFYKGKNYDVASQVGEKFLEKFAGHQHAAKMAFRIGQCHYKAEEYLDAGESFDKFAKLFPDDKLASDALFWAGESYRQGKRDSFAFRRYNRCRWDFPASEAAKYARGPLALPEMLRQFEAEAASVDQ